MTDRFYIGVQALVTLALLVFAAYMEPRSPGTASVIIGAVVAHWLRESAVLSRRTNGRKPSD